MELISEITKPHPQVTQGNLKYKLGLPGGVVMTGILIYSCSHHYQFLIISTIGVKSMILKESSNFSSSLGFECYYDHFLVF